MFALTMTFSLLGWFAIQVNMMSLGVLDLFSMDSGGTYTASIMNIILGVLITGASFYGIRGINLLSDISMPLLFITMGYALFTREESVVVPAQTFSFAGISLVIAMSIAVIIDLPTYFRHAKTCRDAYVSISIIFILVLPFLEILGVYLSSGSSAEGILEVLKRQDGLWWNGWVAAFLILAGWTTNNLNLYSGVASLEFLFKRSSKTVCTLAFGGVGTLLACWDVLAHLGFVLDVMGIFIASIGAVVIARYFLSHFKNMEISESHLKWHFLAWTLGIVCGFVSMIYGVFTSIPVLDATIASSACTILFITLLMFKKQGYEEVYSR
jgi:purine-cytosine permease-like protein